ncbi:hypothetical protein C6W18_03465 [Bacillus sp. LLTC93]|nr:hypothetical protein C6W18_03465 [Bacillus sp. LLTC93]
MVVESKTGAFTFCHFIFKEYAVFCLIMYVQLYLLLTYVRTNMILCLCTEKINESRKRNLKPLSTWG